MFFQIFFSPQVKRYMIITYKHGIFELKNDLRLRNLENYEISGKCLNPTEWWIAQYPLPSDPAKMKILLIVAKNYWKAEIKLFS